MAIVPFQDLPIVDKPFDFDGKNRAQIENEILGDDLDWAKYRKAHLWYSTDVKNKKVGYKLIIARPDKDGVLKVFWRQLVAALAVLNGARGGVFIPSWERKRAFGHGLKYYRKLEVPQKDWPKFRLAARVVHPDSVELSQDMPDDDAAPVWVQIAREGDYRGYDGGYRPFKFTAEMFGQIVENFRDNPSYRADETGVGCEGVIAWDFEHASETHSANGTIPIAGAPAQGWIVELSARQSDDGKAQLWGLTKWLEPARTYIKDGKYKWASVSVVLDAVHPETGDDIGALLTSVAMTNGPFIEGMDQLAAQRYNYFPAGSPREIVAGLRDILNLAASATIDEIGAELARFSLWLQDDVVPEWIDLDGIAVCIRSLLEIPAEASTAEVITKSLHLITKFANEGKPSNSDLEDDDEQETIATTANKPTGGDKMEDLIKNLAEKLSVRPAEAEVIEAVNDHITLRKNLKDVTDSDKDSTKVLLENVQASMESVEQLKAIAKAIGAEELTALLPKVLELLEKETELEALLPVVKEMEEDAAAREEEMVAQDVEQIMQSRKLPSEVKEALTLFRKSDAKRFAELYPALPAGHPNLIKNIATDGGKELDPVSGKPLATDAGSDVIDLAQYPGRNATERAMSYVLATKEDADKLSRDDLFIAAVSAKQLPHVTDSRAN